LSTECVHESATREGLNVHTSSKVAWHVVGREQEIARGSASTLDTRWGERQAEGVVPVIAAIFGSGGHADDVLRDFDFPNDHVFAPTQTFVRYVSEVVDAAFATEPWRARHMHTARGCAPALFSATDSWERAVPATLTLVCVCVLGSRAPIGPTVLDWPSGSFAWKKNHSSEDVRTSLLGSTNQRLRLPQ
jgi:hypothetical protein